MRALARIRDDGIARAVGLSNVSLTQLEYALAIAAVAAVEIEAVEIELHPWRLDAVRGGLVAACTERGIRVLAHRPLGGPAGVKRLARDPVLVKLAKRHDATPAEIVLAWLRTLSPAIVPLPGATRLETVGSAMRGQRLVLDDDACETLAAHWLAVGDAAPNRTQRSGAEVVVILGMPAAGKSTLAADYVARGYLRLNRDDRGGSLLELARALDRELAGGADRIVVDNTYASRASRAPVVDVARRHGIPVRCVVVATSIEDAQAYAVTRILERFGALVEPPQRRGEIGPGAQFRWRREYEPPRADEGFVSIEEVSPVRVSRGGRSGIVVELDGIVWTGRPQSAASIVLAPGVAEALAAWSDHVVGATLWRPGLAAETIAAMNARLDELLGRSIDVRYCPHLPGPPVCWCRKPLPGLGLALARDHDLDPARTVHVGRGPADRGFAQRAGMRYAAIEDGWPTP